MSNGISIAKIIVDRLEEPTKRRFQEMIDVIIAGHIEATQKPNWGFTYLGKVYKNRASVLLRHNSGPNLHPSMHFQMEEALEYKRKVETDMQMIRQAIFPIVTNAKTKQEIRDGLPECLVVLCPELKPLDRLEGPAHMLPKTSPQMQVFLRLLPRMQFYSAEHLIH